MSNLIMEIKVCSIENCSNKMKAKGLCSRHYFLYYFKSEKGKEANKKARKKYEMSEKGKKARKKYEMSEKGKEANKKYAMSEKGKEANKKYATSEKGKEAIKKANKKFAMSEKGKEVSRKISQKRRAKKRTSLTDNFFSREIFERDNWMCKICNEPVDKFLKHPDLKSASLDHIIPLSRGGSHTKDNVQCSHLICNIRKNAK